MVCRSFYHWLCPNTVVHFDVRHRKGLSVFIHVPHLLVLRPLQVLKRNKLLRKVPHVVVTPPPHRSLRLKKKNITKTERKTHHPTDTDRPIFFPIIHSDLFRSREKTSHEASFPSRNILPSPPYHFDRCLIPTFLPMLWPVALLTLLIAVVHPLAGATSIHVGSQWLLATSCAQ